MVQQKQQLFELLKQDHREVDQLMQRMEAASDEQREEIFLKLRDALEEHMELEEKEFYPHLEKIPELEEMAQDALDEHQEIKDHLSDLEDMDLESDEWQEVFDAMQDVKTHHVEDEEQKVFPQCAKLMKQDQLQAIGEKVGRAKQKLHPAKPSAGRGKTTGRQPRA